MPFHRPAAWLLVALVWRTDFASAKDNNLDDEYYYAEDLEKADGAKESSAGPSPPDGAADSSPRPSASPAESAAESLPKSSPAPPSPPPPGPPPPPEGDNSEVKPDGDGAGSEEYYYDGEYSDDDTWDDRDPGDAYTLLKTPVGHRGDGGHTLVEEGFYGPDFEPPDALRFVPDDPDWPHEPPGGRIGYVEPSLAKLGYSHTVDKPAWEMHESEQSAQDESGGEDARRGTLDEASVQERCIRILEVIEGKFGAFDDPEMSKAKKHRLALAINEASKDIVSNYKEGFKDAMHEKIHKGHSLKKVFGVPTVCKYMLYYHSQREEL